MPLPVESCQGKVVGERVRTGAGVDPSVRHWKRIWWVLPHSPSTKQEFLRMKVTMLSLMAAIPLIPHSVGSVPAFAQSPANISQHLPLVVNRNPLLFWFFHSAWDTEMEKSPTRCAALSVFPSSLETSGTPPFALLPRERIMEMRRLGYRKGVPGSDRARVSRLGQFGV